MTSLTISQLARRSGVPATTLRYYEKVGVIPPATRNHSGYRLYDEQALARLAFVQRAKALGVELDDLADLVRLWDVYTFDLRIDGAVRQLDISTGAGGEPAVRALLGLEQ